MSTTHSFCIGLAFDKDVISAMTLEEKVSLVVGNYRRQGSSDSNAAALVRGLVPGAAGTTMPIPKLGITSMVMADGPAGLRINPSRENDTKQYYCTAFPIATLLASSWDTELVYQVGQAMGNEVREFGADILLAPAINLHRNPLCGRNFEYYSEDPLVTGKMAAAMVKGVQSQGVGTSIKHFAANNQETNRNRIDTIVSERALREIYLEGFRIAVQEAQPWTVMSAYNKINGSFASESQDLLTKILREDWGFKGLVMTDWGAGTDAAAQMKAGNDLLMPGNSKQFESIIAAVEQGSLDEKVLDKNVERILTLLMKTPRYKGYKYSNKPNLKANAQIARRAAAEGMVLLKNEKAALPLSKDIKKAAVFGITSYNIITGGTGSGDVSEAYSISLIEGLKNGGLSIADSLNDAYLNYIKQAVEAQRQAQQEAQRRGQPRRGPSRGMARIAEMEPEINLINTAADQADIAFITIGRNSGEGSDRQKGQGDFELTDTEKTLIRQVTGAFQSKGKKVVVILNIGGAIEMSSWRELPDAILLAWQPGQEAGNSIVDCLSGKVNPSGRLASSFPVSYDDVPSAKNFPGIIPTDNNDSNSADSSGRRTVRVPSEVIYEEDIYVGYRYYNTFNLPVAYEFGYGLSYAQFEYGNIKLSSKEFKDKLKVSVDIKNTGKSAGREVVQVYLSPPAVKLKKPKEELAAFGKTRLLNPGQKQTLTFEINARDLASFDTSSSGWIAEAGQYVIKIGSSSRNIRQTASFKLDKEIIVKKENNALAPNRKINTLSP